MGQLGPSTEEKCSSNGARLLSGRSSIIAPTLVPAIGLCGVNISRFRVVHDEIVSEKKGAEKATYAVIPYDAITNIVYERSAHRRYGSALLINPLLVFSRGKKHWLTIEFTDVADLPQGYVYMRLDKNNQRQILSALGSGTGIEIEQIIED